MIRRLTVILALMGVAWFVVSRVRKQIFGNAGTDGLPATVGGASIDQIVRSEPLQPSPPPAASETPPPSEEEGITPPHGDPLAQELAEGRENHTPAETAGSQAPADGGENHAQAATLDGAAQGETETPPAGGTNGARTANSEPQAESGQE